MNKFDPNKKLEELIESLVNGKYIKEIRELHSKATVSIYQLFSEENLEKNFNQKTYTGWSEDKIVDALSKIDLLYNAKMRFNGEVQYTDIAKREAKRKVNTIIDQLAERLDMSREEYLASIKEKGILEIVDTYMQLVISREKESMETALVETELMDINPDQKLKITEALSEKLGLKDTSKTLAQLPTYIRRVAQYPKYRNFFKET